MKPTGDAFLALFPVLVAAVLVLSSVVVALRSLRGTDQDDKMRSYITALTLLAGSGAVVYSLDVALEKPGSEAAFVIGAIGATACYGAVLPDLFEDESATHAVGVSSILWITGSFTVGTTVAADTGHRRLAGVLGLAIGVASLGAFAYRRYSGRETYTPERGAVVLTGTFVMPVMTVSVFGEELLFVAYLVVVVLGVVLWWFRRLADAQS